MIRKTKLTYEIDRHFYTKLIAYLISNAVLTILIGYFSWVIAYYSGYRDINIAEACADNQSITNFYCWVKAGQESKYFDFIFYGALALLITFILAILILNTFFLANKFYFKRYVRETSYGAVIYRYKDGEIQYLIEEMSLGHISLCKGHIEEGESPEQTTLREIGEETNLAVELDTNFKNTVVYHPNERSIKYVTFFVAESINPNAEPVDTHDNEIKSARFVSLEEGIFNITYDDDRETLIKANKYLLKKKSNK